MPVDSGETTPQSAPSDVAEAKPKLEATHNLLRLRQQLMDTISAEIQAEHLSYEGVKAMVVSAGGGAKLVRDLMDMEVLEKLNVLVQQNKAHHEGREGGSSEEADEVKLPLGC